ncbi:unnamed protein product [Chondrus crispus]|uniref:3'(2'),5'-bisphosphate nucleotidase 1 n=1 Tax=Chondrus crispus TaxID=2769 RepID=R7QAH7_CHOCR|nr:unnamed protein product [Chondrus crispus]CDF35054.1 unnamed protein product [Chondrus crispus]|eukprot:XP_005714873.1 unnamed protein product [Chondrus crispus]
MAPRCQHLTSPQPKRELIDIGQLLGACVDAAKRACAVIRQVEESRKSGGSLEETYKDVSDPRSALTIADVMAQSVVVAPLLRQFPNLTIIGEEDLHPDMKPHPASLPPLKLTCDKIVAPDTCKSVPIEDVCVFCDPLDGTFEFVEGRLDAVQSLIGISVNGTPIAGVIGQPFVTEEPIYGLVGAGVVNLLPIDEPRAKNSGAIVTCSRSSSKPLIKEVIDMLSPAHLLHLGGAGNKVLQVANGNADIAILNFSTSLWDSAAPTAIINALGGCVTDLFGNPIPHYANSRIQNQYGVMASAKTFAHFDSDGRTHKEMCQLFRASMTLDPLLRDTGLRLNRKPQATDIALDLDGNPITASWLSTKLSQSVLAFTADDSTAVRYLMSDACRLQLYYEDQEPTGPESVFLKRIVMKHLEHVKLKARTAPQKLARDVSSYQVEAAFLSLEACNHLRNAGIKVPKSYFTDSRPSKLPIESRFLIILEDFSPERSWKQVGLLDKDKMRCTLHSLACMHAFFWQCRDEPLYETLCEAVWDQATYWVPCRQAPDSFRKLPSCWENYLHSFADSLREAGLDPDQNETLKNLGHLLETRAPLSADKVHGVGLNEEHSHRTIIHGDAKAANFFYRPSKSPSTRRAETGKSSDGEAWEVGIIDFQWCGWGHPAVDVCYLIAASAGPSLLTPDGNGEDVLLEYYYSCLTQFLVEFGKADDVEAAVRLISMEELKCYYEEALLDIARVVISYHWDRIRASPEVLESRKDKLGSNSYNKNLKCAMWLIARTVSLLSRS